MKRERSDDESESGNAPEKRKKHSLNAAMRLTVVKNSVHLSAVSEDGIPSLEASLNEGSSTDLPLESGQEVTIKTADGRTLRFTIDDSAPGSDPERKPEVEVIDLDSDSEASENEQHSSDIEPNQQGGIESKQESDSDPKIDGGEDLEDAHSLELTVKRYFQRVSVQVTLQPHHDISRLKHALKSALEIPVDHQLILADWKPVSEGTLADLGITEKTQLQLIVRPRPVLQNSPTFKLTARTLTGWTFVMHGCRSSDMILELALRIHAKAGIPVDQQRLIFAGHQMEFGQCLSDYRLQKECTIHLVLKLRGS
eukprot:483112_1